MLRNQVTLKLHRPGNTWGLISLMTSALLLFSEDARALDPRVNLSQTSHEVWTARDGLPDGPVFSILQTEQGDLWLGMQSALSRFNGTSFTRFEPGSFGLPQFSFGRTLVQDRTGTIWAGLIGGLASYNAGAFRFFAEAEGLKHPFVYALALDARGTVHVGTGGSGLWTLENGRFQRHHQYQGRSLSGQVNALLNVPGGGLVVGTDAGVVRLTESFGVFGVEQGLPSPAVTALAWGKDGELWIGTHGGLARLSGDELLSFTESEGLASDHVTALLYDAHGTLWIGMQDGSLQRLHLDEDTLSDVEASSERGRIHCLLEDQEGALWLGTGKGLERFRGGPFRPIGEPQGFTEEHILAIHPRKGGGIWVLDASGALHSLRGDVITDHLPPGAIQGQGMLGLAETNDGALWIATDRLLRFHNGELSERSNPGGDFTVLLANGSTLFVAQTDRDGKSTVSSFNEDTFTKIELGATVLHAQRLHIDATGRLWISSGGSGVFVFDKGKTAHFDTQSGLPHDVAYGLAEDARGDIWVATRSGLARIRGGQVESLARIQEAPTRSPVHLHLDHSEHMWVTADDAIYRIPVSQLRDAAEGNTASLSSRRFTRKDGIVSNVVSWRSSGQAVDTADRLWYATEEGVLVVDPARLPQTFAPPHLSIEEVRADGIPSSDSDLSFGSGSKRLEIRYGAIDLSGDNLKFRYRLQGYDKTWIDAGEARVAHYTGVTGGNYEFQVQTYREGQPELRSDASIAISIAPHLLQRWPVRILLASSLALSLWALYFLRIRRLKNLETELRRRVTEQTESLRLEVNERRAAEAEVRELNELLEGRVASRTHQLTETNRALSDQKEQLSVTLGSIAEGVITVDHEARITLINPVAEATLESSEQVLQGSKISDTFKLFERYQPREIEDPISRILRESRDKNKTKRGDRRVSQSFEALLMAPSGAARLIDVSASTIVDEEGTVAGAVLVFRDITERARVQEQLQKSEKLEAVGILAGGIAHDFNNLLTGIFGYIQMAQRKLPEDSLESSWLARAVSVLSDARGLSGQLLTFASGGTPTLETHSLVDLLEQSLSFVFSGAGIETRLNLPESTWDCKLDPQQLRRALDNLLLNARQAMNDEGVVVITSRNVEKGLDQAPLVDGGRFVELSISDNGPGMDEETLEKAFEPFFTTRSAGSGLGLATVQSIVLRHGGAIEVESKKGEGTTFRLLLKAADENSPKPPNSPLLPALNPSPTSRRVLVMDDEETIRDLAEMALGDAGCPVVTCAGGEETIAAFKSALDAGHGFDVVVLDLTIVGGMGGYDTLKHLRALDDQVPIISSSGYYASIPPNSEALQFDASLPKPYILKDLVELVLRSTRNNRSRPSVEPSD